MSHTADLVLTGGPVHTVDPARSRATAVAVRDGRIAAVGHDEVRELIGPRTEVVDLAGKLLLPGFQDAHVHPQGAGLELGLCHLADTVDPAEYLRRIRTYADRNPDVEWITGGGWSLEAFPGGAPTAATLDAIVPDRPVFLPNRDHHGAWVNSRALERAGIDSRTPDPADGRIERDADGNPTGMLQEGAVHLVGRLVPDPTPQQQLAALLRAQAVLHSYGVTAWQDAIVGRYANMTDPAPTYRTALDRGLLTARVVGALWWDRARGAEQIPELIAKREELSGGLFRASTVKVMQDGIAENHTAAMLDPYLTGCGCASDNSGISFVEPGELRKYVTELDAAGLPGPLPRARRPCGARGPRRRGVRPHGQRVARHTPPPRASPGRPPARRPPVPCPGSERQPPDAVGRARTADGRTDPALPRRGTRRTAVPVR